MLTARKNKKNTAISGDYQIVIPKNYKAVQFPFGRSTRNRVLCYKKSKY